MFTGKVKYDTFLEETFFFFFIPTINILVLFWVAHTSISSKLGMPLEPQRYILLYGKYVDIITISMIGMAKEFGDLVKVYIYWRIMLGNHIMLIAYFTFLYVKIL